MQGFSLIEFVVALLLFALLLSLSEIILSSSAANQVFNQSMWVANEYLSLLVQSDCQPIPQAIPVMTNQRLSQLTQQCRYSFGNTRASIQWKSTVAFWRCALPKVKHRACLSNE